MAARYNLPPGYGPAAGCGWEEIGHERRAAWDAAASAAIAAYIELNGGDPVDARAVIAEALRSG